MTEYEEKLKELKEFCEGLHFEMPTEEEIEKAYRIYLDHQANIERIMYSMGVNYEEAHKIALEEERKPKKR